MKELLKCHLSYLFTRNVIIIVLFATLLCNLIFYTSVIDIDNGLTLVEVCDNYYFETMFSIKIIFIFPIIFLFLSCISTYNDYYAYFILTSQITRVKYIISKILVNIILVFILYFILLLSFIVLGFIYIKHFQLTISYLLGFFNSYLLALVYGFYAMLAMQLCQNIYIIILVFASYVVSNVLIEGFVSFFSNLFVFIFPTMQANQISAVYGLIHLFWLLISLFIVNVLYYSKKDLNY